ncbi:unnamed protein product [Rotaria sp. Silwood2]|nr:unnamed protein product [Rotaria sp. Silwood2]
MAETTSQNQSNKCKRLYFSLTNINLFGDQDAISLVDQLLATRIFLFLLVISLSIVIVFSTVTVQTQTVTIESPTEITFQQLSVQYSSTLSCSCTQISIRHNQFVLLNPRYHSICTSQFVNQTFISSLNDYKMSDYYPLDYRIMAASHFQVIALLCQTITQMVSDVLEEFATRYIITNKVLSHSIFNAQVKALVEQLKSITIANVKSINDFLWFNIFQNQIQSGLRTNYFIQAVPGALTNKFVTVRYKTLNKTCSCSSNNVCTHQVGIYNQTGRAGVNISTKFGDLTTDPPLLLTIPGIMVGCLPYDSLLRSTFECFYNQSCIDQIQIFINGLELITPLSSSRFEHNTTVNNLFDQLFIELWNQTINFTGYFQVCSPHSCTYSYARRFDLLYVIVTLISLFGGLKTILFFSTPQIVKFIRKFRKIQNVHNTNNVISTINPIDINQNRLIFKITEVYEKILKLNMFPLSSDITDGIYSTRIYILLFVTGIFILVFYSSIIVRIRIHSVYQPSIDEYEQLYSQYSSTLVCPCTHLSVPYSSIIQMKPYYHQVCSSDIVKNNGWLLYFNGLVGAFYSLDFRIRGFKIFAILQTLCSMSNETITNKLAVFNDLQFVSARVVTKNAFNTQIFALIQQFKQQTLASFLDLFQLVLTSIQLNQFITSGASNAQLLKTIANNNDSFRFISNNDWENDCSCGTNVSCIRSEGFYCRTTSCFISPTKPNQTIPGLVASCLLVDSLLASSLECFYNESCIQMLIQWHSFGSPNVTIDPRVANITPLDATVNNRFSPNTRLGIIVSQLFIEDWANSTNFSYYYNQCAPDECTYTYEERFNRAYVIATIVGIAGGLSTALRILILPVVKLLRRMYYHCHRPKKPVVRECFAERGIQLVLIVFFYNSYKITISLKYFRHFIQTINLYHEARKTRLTENLQTAHEQLIIKRQKMASRFYIILFVAALVIIVTFTGLNSQIYSMTISSPTEFIFEQLQAQYSSSLSCPCSQIAIQYSNFLSVKPIAYHQVCSSYFVSDDFIKLLWGTELYSLVLGCLPIYGLRLSTLECLYNSTCLQKLFNLTNRIEDIPSSLDISIYTRFSPVSSITIGTLIDELFIEVWQNESNYSNYFSICAPLTCRYTYAKRNDVLYILTTFLGLYGGLTVGLKFMVWHSLHINSQVQQRFTVHRRRIESINYS